jgi:putative inorganic carbon (HCO3(-)) transporter
MPNARISDSLDAVIRFFLYLLIFGLPYSPAVVEICIGASFFIWCLKRAWLYCQNTFRSALTLPRRFFLFLEAFKPQTTFLNPSISFFLLICLLSVGASAFREVALRGFLTKTLEWFVVYFLVVEVFQKRRHFQVALSVFLLTTFATLVDGLVQSYITQKDIFYGQALERGCVTAAFKHPNSLGAYLTFVLPITLSLCLVKGKRKGLKGLFVLIFVLSLWVAALTSSRGAWLGMLLGLFLFLWFWKRKFAVIVIAFFLVGILGFYVFAPLGIPKSLRLDPNSFNTGQWRGMLWRDSFSMVVDRPFFGHGLNTFMSLFREYGGDLFYESPTYAHNCYIQMAAEIGLFGLMAFLWMMARFFQKGFMTIASFGRGGKSKDLRVIFIGLLSGVAAFLAHSFFDVNFYSLQLYDFFWVMVGMAVSLVNFIESGEHL